VPTIYVLIKTESHYPINRKDIDAAVRAHLDGKVKRDTEVSIAIAGDRLMKSLNKTYRKKDYTTDVLSFTFTEALSGSGPFVESPEDDILRLGDIIVSYPEAVREAGEMNRMVDDVVRELVLHGLDHLLGIHHPE